MDETAKTEARNYLTAAGFLVVAGFWLISGLNSISNLHSATLDLITGTLPLISGIGILLISILLIVLRKRDMIALFFAMMSFTLICFGFFTGLPGPMIFAAFAGLILLTLFITLTGKDKAKWLLIVFPVLLLIRIILSVVLGMNLFIILWILGILALYYAFASGSERFSFPGKEILTADEETNFKASGSVLGYMLIAVTSGTYIIYYLFGDAMIHLAQIHTVNIVAAVLLIIVAVLLLAIGKMRFTPVMFLLYGLIDLLSMYSTGIMFIGCGIVFIVIGLFAMLRKESRILPGIMLIAYGCTCFFTAYAGGNMPIVSVILNAIPCLIAIYLAFVVYSQKKLPKF